MDRLVALLGERSQRRPVTDINNNAATSQEVSAQPSVRLVVVNFPHNPVSNEK